MDFFTKIFKKENNRYALPMVTGLVALALAVIAFVCARAFSPQQVESSYPLSIGIVFLYVMLMCFFSSTLVRVLTIATRLKYHRTLKFVLMIAFILLMRFLTISQHLPRQLFQTMFFTQQGYLENFYAESIGVLFIDVCIFLALAFFGARCFADFNRPFVSLYRTLSAVLLMAEFFMLLALSTLIPYMVGRFVTWGRFELNPCNMMNFDGNSVMFTFILFGLGYGVCLLLKKVAGAVFRYFQGRSLPSLLFIGGAFLLYLLFCLVCKRLFSGFPVRLWLLFVALQIAVSLLWLRFERQNYRFFIVMAEILMFSLITSMLISYHVQKKDRIARAQLVQNLVTTTPVASPFLEEEAHPAADSVDLFFSSVYSGKILPIGYAWVVKSDRHLDREAIMNYPDETALSSFAYYVEGHLTDQYGGYDYLMDVNSYLDDIRYDKRHSCIIQNNYRHFIYPISDRETVIVSQRITSKFSLFAAFSFYFIIYTLYYVLALLFGRPFIRMARPLSLYNNMLWAGTLLLLLVGGVLGTLSVVHTYNKWENDRAGLVKVKVGKVQMDLDRSLGQVVQEGDSRREREVDSLLLNISRQYDLLVSVYDTEGRMLYATPTGLVDLKKDMPSDVMAMMRSGNSYCRTREFTDYKDIFCIYKVLMDAHGKVVGYLLGTDIRNHFANDIKLSNLITKHLCFFAWLILLSLAASFLLYFIIYRSMGALGSSMRRRSRPYSPIRLDWEVNEEIGALIHEHNQMVEELRENAVRMAKSERETAWREMALEISHEVKNPLTPMRLKMQLLQKAWQSHRPDIGKIIGDATDEVIRQTETLSEVSDIFFEFARSQSGVNADTDIKKLLEELLDELIGVESANYEFKVGERPEYRALVDRELFRQMVANLVKNARHNRPDHGRLKIRLALGDDVDPAFWLFTFAANDRGLDLTDEGDVFSVKFSSVNRGYSLCLPIVKNIVVSFNGSVSFETSPESGTKFYIKIPKL